MDCTAQRIPYRQTGCFTRIILDYIDQAEQLRPYYAHPPTLLGIEKAIQDRKNTPTDRSLLVSELRKQYENVGPEENVSKNIEALLSENTFTVCTAHQPNIFTGPVFFIYKILHAIKLSHHLQESFPSFRFVPVYYMGSEDADLEELGHIFLNGEKLVWSTNQSGAVGRMKIDADFLNLVSKIERQLRVEPFGEEICELIQKCYKTDTDIKSATFEFVHALVGKYGLIVFQPDNGSFKKKMIRIFEDDLLHQAPSEIVDWTSDTLSKLYKIQASPREINLFYLKDNIRERIIKRAGPQDSKFIVQSLGVSFTAKELIKELNDHPERFSPNVILRGLYQETILPNIIFTGGGGELAYWLQLKDLFGHYKVPYPVLVLRNSFLFVENKWREKVGRLGFTTEDFFLPEQELLNRIISRESKNQTRLNGTYTETEQLYRQIKNQAAAVDVTLGEHVEALRASTLRRLHELEKKMLRAEKRKFTERQGQIHSIKEKLFPGGQLQERHDNILSFYSKWGEDFITKIYDHSLNLEHEFVLLEEMR